MEYLVLLILGIVFIQGFCEGRKNSDNSNRKKTYWTYRDPKTGIGFGMWL